MDKRLVVRFLGTDLGTADGWDGDNEAVIYYSFIPAQGIDLPKGDLSIDWAEGRITKWNSTTEEDELVRTIPFPSAAGER